MKNLYTLTQVDPGVYNISENITDRPIKFSQQLVVGTQRAAMIDAGFGIDRDLLKEIRKITQLPVICLLTHGDPDHTGGAELFDQVYMNPADDAVMKPRLIRAFACTRLTWPVATTLSWLPTCKPKSRKTPVSAISRCMMATASTLAAPH
ncbi:MBL fold metallo-hydrolase [Lacticaseibacillus camelliae]|uniref:MBL fold metallo-hydrolase n=1 Tax=Lacticaseibacillus camelliae TaxID=381742 RepID=UPI0006D25A7A|nr:MBL fold metallo-hydrolase [Lacticaseibacillus camelliae]